MDDQSKGRKFDVDSNTWGPGQEGESQRGRTEEGAGTIKYTNSFTRSEIERSNKGLKDFGKTITSAKISTILFDEDGLGYFLEA